MSGRSIGWALLLGVAAGCQTEAAEIGRMFGHEIAIAGSMPAMSLQIDGRPVLKDATISLSELVMVAGVPTLVGNRSAGGNACDGSPFILSFPAGSPPRLDGPIDACASIAMEVSADHLDFRSRPVAGQDGERWTWSPGGGLKAQQNVAFTADAGKGWSQLRQKTLQHPSEIFEYGEIADQLDALLGDDKSNFEEIITGVGSGEFKGDDYVGSACAQHLCDSTGALVFLSIRDKSVYIAWKPEDEDIVVRPPVKQWPDRARRALKQWAEQWP
jgi:hypothetical protein